MKKPALFLLLTASLFAEGQEYCNPCIDTCCEPSCQFSATVGFLYWYGKEDHLSIAYETESQEFTDNVLTVNFPQEEHYMKSRWDPGFRVGLGLELCSGWKASLQWSYMKIEEEESLNLPAFSESFGIPLNGQRAFSSPWIFSGTFFAFPLLFSQVAADWELHFHMLDFAFSKSWCFSPCFFFEPRFGLRGLWTNIDYFLTNLEGTQTIQLSIVNDHFLHFKNKYSGVGLFSAFEPVWYFSPCFGLYGSLGFALLWGEKKETRSEEYRITSDNFSDGDFFTTKGKHYGMQGMLDLGIGIRFHTLCAQNRYVLGVDFGWENHTLLDHVHRFQIPNIDNFLDSIGSAVTTFQKTQEIYTDLNLGGFVLKVQVGF